MSEPVTPKAERRVIDGEVVPDAADSLQEDDVQGAEANARRRAHNRAGQNTRQNAERANPAAAKSARLTAWHKPLLWGTALAGVVAVVLYTRPDTDWQVEHINQLQSQVAQLHETNQLLVARMEQQKQALQQQIEQQVAQQIDEKLATALQQSQNPPQNESLISKGDLEAIQETWRQQLDLTQQQLEKQLDTFGEELQAKWQALRQSSQQAGEALPSGEEAGAALQQLEQKLQTEITRISDQLAGLFALDAAPTAPPQIAPQGLSNAELNAWRIAINAQWLLHGDVPQTQSQLLALEQALAVSESADKTELARRIGQDLTALTQYEAQAALNRQQQQAWMTELRGLIAQLPEPALQLTSPEPAAPETTTEVPGESTAWTFLLTKLAALVNVKKREDEQSLSQVQRLWQHDVVLQRLQLWTDRLQWALQSQAKSEALLAAGEIDALLAQHFEAQQAAFKPLLNAVRAADLQGRPALQIAAGLN